MTDRRTRILVVDDDRAVVDALVEMLRDRYDVEGLVSAPEALHRVCAEQDEEIDLLIADVEMPHMRGLELLEAVQRRKPNQLVLLITAFGSIDLAVRAVRTGACDFMSKPFTSEALIVAIERVLRERTMRREVVRLRRELIGGERGLVASSTAMQRVLDTAARAARSDAPVLLMGESGVGKGAVARWIHERGPRATGPLIQVNCAALPSGLIEAELFGVRRGAFTDARENRDGLFAEASGGTIFLDEIAEMPPPAQAKLLQVLETSRIRPVGATGEIEVDARVIAATNRPIEEAVNTGTFRSDLFYRLNVIPLEIPPLRARPEDIPELVHAILERAARGEPTPIGITDDAMQWLMRQPWPGNVRQLANVLERAIALTDHPTLTLVDVADIDPRPVEGVLDETLDLVAARYVSLSEFEHAYIRQVIAAAEGNMARAARILRIDRRTLYRKLTGEQ
jgi:DNA-binding NtrC family response regulator